MVRLFLFGPPRLELNGQAVPLRRTKALALLVYLATTRQPQDRDTLLALLWPEFDDASARNNLRRELSLLKSTLGEELLTADRRQLVWNDHVAVWVDVAVFQEQVAIWKQHQHAAGMLCATCAAALTTAAQLSTDDFLAGFGLPDSPAFDEWQFFEREELRQQLATALQSLIAWHCEKGAYEHALRYARRWLALDRLHEPAQRELMRLYTLSGQQAAALRQYDECVRLFERELGAEPEAETMALYEAIKARQVQPLLQPVATKPSSGRNSSFTNTSKLSVVTVQNLPPQATPLVGRERELKEICAHLRDSGCRVLTLIGPGGIGKTRLAHEVSVACAADFRHGACFTSLVSVSDPQLLAQTILESLNVHLIGDTAPKDQLLAYLREKHLLLLLDNFEQLTEGAGLVSQIVAARPGITILVTSRERLNIGEEWAYSVPGLEYPTAKELIALGEKCGPEAYGAVQLFLTYARRAQANFVLQPDDLPHVVRICRLLDGMPLGLELAAPWVESLGCHEIAAEIAGSLDFLGTSLSRLPERHRSLRAVYVQTWQRLACAEQEVLRRLSIFHGGCTRDAAEQVAGATLVILQNLVGKALVRRTPDGRYEMHELVRQFAHEQLHQVSEAHEQVQERHCAYYMTLLAQRTDGVRGGRQPQAVAEIAADMDNIRAAWQSAVAHQATEKIGQALECLCNFYTFRSTHTEGEVVFRQAAQAFGAPSTRATVHVLSDDRRVLQGMLMAAQGYLGARRGASQEGIALMQRGLAFTRAANQHDPLLDAIVICNLGSIYLLAGKHGAAQTCAQEALPTFIQHDYLWGMTLCLNVLGIVAYQQGLLAEAGYFLHECVQVARRCEARIEWHNANYYLCIVAIDQGEYGKATHYIAENMALNRELDNPPTMVAQTLRQQAQLDIAQGALDQAVNHMEQNIAVWREGGINPRPLLGDLGIALRLQGHYDQAQDLLLQCLVASQAIGHARAVAHCLAELGRLAADQGNFVRAEQCHREALAIWQQSNQIRTAVALSDIAWALVAQGRVQEVEAQHCYTEALRAAVQHQLVPLVLDVCVGVARLRMALKLDEQAEELLTFVLHHPAGTFETKARARQALALLPTLPAASSRLLLDWRALAEQLNAELAQPVLAVPQARAESQGAT
jgi:predicted ATPase/DNA-binding SARP family transcriptional activator